MNPIDFPSLPRMIHLKSSFQEDLSFFRIGEVLEGKVVKQIDDHHVLIQMRDHDFLAESHLPLQPDMKGHFRVEAADPQVILRLIPEGEREDLSIASWAIKFLAGNSSLKNLSKALESLWAMKPEEIPPPVRNTVEQLRTLLHGFSLQEPFSLGPEDLQKFVNQSGLFFEHQLGRLVESHEKDRFDQVVMKDLKGLAIRLRSQLRSLLSSGNSPGKHLATLKELVRGLDRLLDKIEGYQILNLHSSDPQEKIFLLLPLWFQNHLQFVEMNLSQQASGRDLSESEEISILFLLHLPEWGEVSIEVKVRGTGLYCLFKVTDPEVSTFLNQAFPDLERALNRIGFQVQVGISVEDPEKIPQSFVSEQMESESLLNIVI